MKELYYNKDTREEDKQTFEDSVFVCDTIEEYNKVLRKFRKEFKDYGGFTIGKQQTFNTLYGIEVNAKGFQIKAEDNGGIYLRFITKYYLKPNA